MMKVLAIFVLLAAWTRSGDAVRCVDVSSCVPDVSLMQLGSPTMADIAAVCKSVRDTITCFREAMKDCRKTQAIPEQIIQRMETQIDSYDHMLDDHCPNVGQ